MIAPIKEPTPHTPHGLDLYDTVACVWAREADGRIELEVALYSSGELNTGDARGALTKVAACLANDPDLVRRALQGDKKQFRGALLDAMKIARLCAPCERVHSLAELLFELTQDDELMPGAEALVKAWPVMIERMLDWPAPIVDAMQQFAGAGQLSGVGDLLFRLGAAVRARGRAPVEISACFPFEKLEFPRRELLMHEECGRLDVEACGEILGPRGEFAGEVKGYEFRPGQVEMMRAVADSINTQRHVMVEAGTGVGKSLAYLVPCAMWSVQNNMPVVVSTNTKNLQSQLCDKDLPAIRRLLLPGLRFALLKGRGNYLCLRRIEHLLRYREQELTDDECAGMVYILSWLATTVAGDLGELRVDWLPPRSSGLPWQIASRAEECSGRACRNYGRCFLQKARAKAWSAHVIVANHSLVFAEMGTPNAVLPEHRQVVFDEAHNLEDAATRHFSVEISSVRVNITLRRLWRRRGSSERGLLCTLKKQIEGGVLSANAGMAKRLQRACSTCRIEAELLGKEMEPFFNAIGGLLPKSGACSRRLRIDIHEDDAWREIECEQKNLLARLGKLAQALGVFGDIIKEATDEELGFSHEAVSELEAAALWMREFAADVEFVSALSSDAHVFWVERGGSPYALPQLWAAPLRVGSQLSDQLYAQKDSVVFCSATLSVGGRFAYMQNRLGIDRIDPERLQALQAESPFDYMNQCTVLVPAFLTDPAADEKRYTRELSELLEEAFAVTEGRGLALFTSYAMLRECCGSLREKLAAHGIRVLAQGEGVSREQLTSQFRDEINSVLMGTHSFWEGVDVVGESLSCVVVARLPFASVGDPVIAARCEQVEQEGRSSFNGFSLPNAVIRFRQGFGRLIRHRGDHGVVIVTDTRIVTKRYGAAFRHSLPCRTVKLGTREEFLDALAQALPRSR